MTDLIDREILANVNLAEETLRLAQQTTESPVELALISTTYAILALRGELEKVNENLDSIVWALKESSQ